MAAGTVIASAPAAALAATIAPRKEQSAGAAVQALEVAGSGSSFLSTVKVAARADAEATRSRHAAMSAANKRRGRDSCSPSGPLRIVSLDTMA